MNRTIVGCVLFTGISLARAADPEPLELGALLAEAERAHPGVLAQSERAAAAGERAEAAGALPDPRLSVSYTNDSLSELTLGESQFSSVTVRWDQEVPRKSARQLDAEVARRESGSALAAQQALRARLRARVVDSYAAIWRADRLRALFLESREVLATAREAARARYETGEGGQQAVLRAQTEVRRVDVELEGLARERRAAEIALAETLGRRDDPHFGPAGALPTVELRDPGSLEADAIAAGPETLVARAETDRAHAAVEHARAQAKPEWGWMAAYQYLGSLDPMVMGGVTVRLPLWSNSKQARTIAQGEREAAAAQRDREASELVSLARVRELTSEIESIERQRTLLEEALIPEGIASLEAARAAFSAGRAEMTLVLDDLARLLADRRTAVDLAARRVVLAASLEAVTGARIVAGGER